MKNITQDQAVELLIALKATTTELAWLNNNNRILANAPERKRIAARLDIARAAIDAASEEDTPAPDSELLKVLEALVNCKDYQGIKTHEMSAARAAIAKAQG